MNCWFTFQASVSLVALGTAASLRPSSVRRRLINSSWNDLRIFIQQILDILVDIRMNKSFRS